MGNTCGSAVTLNGNAFANLNLHANSYYATEVAQAVTQITDPTLAAKAARFGGVGTFKWIDTISVIPLIDSMIKAVPCTEIIGFVIYDLPGRDCASGASAGELPVGSLARYQSEYIDPIRDIILANPTIAIALIIEPDSLPNLITNANLTGCLAAAQGYKDGIAYALAQLNLPNVVMYVDAGNSGWLGWNANLAPGGKLIADVWKAAGSPGQFRGISTNVANWNAWSQIPGEFSSDPDAQYNPAQDEQRYVNLMGAQLAANGAPNHAIIDTGRNGITGLRIAQGDWCNVKGAGFGALPTSNTGNPLADAFVWVKAGGESDGVSDPSAPRYDPACSLPDAFAPSPQAGEWNQAYFEQLVTNAIALPATVPSGFWYGGSGADFDGGQIVQFAVSPDVCTYETVPHATRDWCDNVDLAAGCNFNDTTNGALSVTNMQEVREKVNWMSIPCDDPVIVNVDNLYNWTEIWEYAQADSAFYQLRQCWIDPGHANIWTRKWSGEVFAYFHGPDLIDCSEIDDDSCILQSCTDTGHPAGKLIMNSFFALNRNARLVDDSINNAQETITGLLTSDTISTFSPDPSTDNQLWVQLLLDAVGLGFAAIASPVWKAAMAATEVIDEANVDFLEDVYNAVAAAGVSATKDTISAVSSDGDAATDLTALVANLTIQWKNANKVALQALMLGDPTGDTVSIPLDDSYNTLWTAISRGMQLYPIQDTSTLNTTAASSVMTAFSGTIIPAAWALSNDQHHPFIMIPNNQETLVGCKIPPDIDEYVDPAAQADSLVCVGSLPFYILSIRDGCPGCGISCVRDNCGPKLWTELPGMNLLIEESAWGITRDDMVWGSIASWQQYGNGYAGPNASDLSSFSQFSNDDFIRGPGGLFNFPVCGAVEATTNWNTGGMAQNPNYPCNP